MAFLRKLFGGQSAQPPADNGVYFHIRCDRCQTPVKVRVNLGSDLEADYGDTAATGYVLSKEVMDDRCFRLMRLEVHYDSRQREESRVVDGGTFITAEEYTAAKG